MNNSWGGCADKSVGLIRAGIPLRPKYFVLHETFSLLRSFFNGMRNAGGAWEAAESSGKLRMRSLGCMIYLKNSICGMTVIETMDLLEVEEVGVELEDVLLGIGTGGG